MEAARAQLGQIRSFGAQLFKNIQRKIQSCLISDRRQMQHRVGRSTDAHIHRDRIFKGLHRHDVARLDVAGDQIHHGNSRVPRQLPAGPRMRRWNGSVSGQPHSQGFRHTIHAVRGKKAGARSTARTIGPLHIFEFLFADLAGFKQAGRFEGSADTDVFALISSGEHRSAADHYGGNIQAGCRHQHTGSDLVTVRDHNQAIQSMAVRHCFHRVGNQFPARQRIAHSFMSHGDSVTNPDGRKFNRDAARLPNAVFGRFGNLPQMHVSRNQFVE